MSQFKWEWIPALLFFVLLGMAVFSNETTTLVVDGRGLIGGIVLGAVFCLGVLRLEHNRQKGRKHR